jgi:CBS domain-containing protein
MQPDVVTVAPSLSVETLVEDYIYRLHHKMFPITDNGRLLGCVTTRDVQAVPRNEWATTTVARISQGCEKDNTIAPASDAMQALARMSQAGVSRMMVVDNEHLVGLLSLSDLLKFIALKIELEDDDGTSSDKITGSICSH